MKVSIKRPVEHLSYSSDHYGVEEALVEVHERIKVRVSKTDVGIWIDGVKTLQFIPQSVVDPRYYATEPEEPKKAPPKKRVPPDPEGGTANLAAIVQHNMRFTACRETSKNTPVARRT